MILEKDKSPEEITEQLKQLTKQLNYKEKYEKEQEKLMEQYKQNADTHKQNADTYKRLLEEERLRNEETAKHIEVLNKENMQRIFEELKTEVTKSLTVSEEIILYKNEMLEKVNSIKEENLMQKVLIDELKEEIIQLKNQLAAYEKQCEGHANHCKELNEISEKRIHEAMDAFNQQIKDTEEVCRKELYNLQVIVEEHKKEIIENKRLRDKQSFLTTKCNEEITQLRNKLTFVQVTEQEDLQFTEKFQDIIKKLHYKELNSREVIYEKRINKVIDMFNKHLKDREETQKKEFDNLKLEIEEFKGEEAKKFEDSKETCKANSTLIEKLVWKEVQNIEEQLKKQNLVIDSSNKASVDKENTLMSKLEDYRRIFVKEFDTRLEEFEQATKKEKEIVYRTIKDIQLEVDKLVYYFNQQSQPQNTKVAHIIKDYTQPMLEAAEQNDKNHKNECTTISNTSAKLSSLNTDVLALAFSGTNETTESSVEHKAEAAEDTPPNSGASAKESSLNPDVLALMQKTRAYQNSALSYDLETATITVDCDDLTEKEKIKEEFYIAYWEMTMGGKLKEHAFPVDDVQQANVIVDEYTKTFSHTYFRYDPEKKEIKCLSTDARQMQNVQRWLNSMKKAAKVKAICIDLPKLSRRVTIKFGDIVEEEVDIIVNAANDRLMHAGGVAAAIDKASYGAVQKESNQVILQTGTLPTGKAVITSAGGKLKCKSVIHAVGPIAYQHKDQCADLLLTACVNSLVLAQRNKAKSISFPPISSDIFGVSKELVANVMLSSLCSYTCSDPELLNDVRIVIIDEPTFDVFIKFFNEEKENLKLLQHTRPTEDSTKVTATSHHMHDIQSKSALQLGPQKGLSNLKYDK